MLCIVIIIIIIIIIITYLLKINFFVILGYLQKSLAFGSDVTKVKSAKAYSFASAFLVAVST